MSGKPTAASVNARLDAYIAEADQRLTTLDSQFATLALAVQVATSPLNQTAAAPASPAPAKAQRGGLQTPTCVNFRKCGVRSEGVPLSEAIGWKCGGDLAGCK